MNNTDTSTREKILEVATKEFMQNGFADASMRKIAGKVGITATALYRHYKDKEAIFDAVVEPAVQAWEKLCQTEEVRQTGTARESGLDAMWGDNDQARRIVELIYKDFDAHKLLFCKSEGTKYEDYLHEVVTKVQTATLKFMKEIEARDVNVETDDDYKSDIIKFDDRRRKVD